MREICIAMAFWALGSVFRKVHDITARFFPHVATAAPSSDLWRTWALGS